MKFENFLLTILSSIMIKLAEIIFCDVYTNFIEDCRDSRQRFEAFKVNSRNCDELTLSYVWSRIIWSMLRCSKSFNWSSWSLSFKSFWFFSIEKSSSWSTTISSSCTTKLTCSDSFIKIVHFYKMKCSRSFFFEFDIITMISRRRNSYS